MSIVGGNEILRQISSQVEAQFPSFVREEGPGFVSFLKAYYEYMEQSGNATDGIRSLEDIQDIDRTVNDFVEYFRREFMINIPSDVLADKRLLAKHIRTYYQSRGSQESFRFLFRTLYNEEIDFYYPGDDILRASDGRWFRETTLRVAKPFNINPTLLETKQIRGVQSGATGIVQYVISTIASGIKVYDLTIDNVVGIFIDGERVVDVDNINNYVTVNSEFGTLTDIKITNGGAFHQNGDALEISGAGETEIARAIVTKTTDNSAATINLISGGSGFTKENTRLIISGGSGIGFDARIDSYSLESVGTQINNDTIGPLAAVTLEEGPYFVATGANTSTVQTQLTGTVSYTSGSNTFTGSGTSFDTELSAGDLVRVSGIGANTFRVHSVTDATTFVSVFQPASSGSGENAYIGMAAANVYSTIQSALTFSTEDLYSVNAIAIINPGYGYSTLPTIRIVDQGIADLLIDDGYGGTLGDNAIALANNAPGAIEEIRITSAGANFNRNEIATLYNATQGNTVSTYTKSGIDVSGTTNTKYIIRNTTFSGQGTPLPSGFNRLPGRYIDTKGFLSWNNRLQDNFYYQEFSYVVRANQILDKYREILLNTVHPSGTILFGDYRLGSELSLPIEAPGAEIDLETP